MRNRDVVVSPSTVLACYHHGGSCCSALKVTDRIHPLVQNTDNGNAVAGRSEIDDMLLDAPPSITWPDIGAALRLLRRFGQIGASGFDEVGVAHRLR